jgi:hypothetical protein
MSTKTLESSTGDAELSALNRHERKCLVCNHPEREAIEDEYLRWLHPHAIAVRYDLRERSIYIHANATGLRARRAQNRRSVLELILQKTEGARVTGETIIHALRAYSCLDDDGHWREPETRVVFSYQPAVPGLPAHAQSAMIAETVKSGLQNYAIRAMEAQQIEASPGQFGPAGSDHKEILIDSGAD